MQVENFTYSGKALNDPIELDDGDLIIEGFAASFQGVDRVGENFADGAFQRGIKSFLEGSAALLFNHKHEKPLGRVLALEEIPDKGLWLRARIDGAIRSHPELGTYYNQIKKGTLTALSVGGFFGRTLTAAGMKITSMDFTDVSIVPVPALANGTSFDVVAGKSLELAAVEYEIENLTWLRDELAKRKKQRTRELVDLQLSVAGLLD